MSEANEAIKKMPPGHEPATKALVFAFIFCAGIWLLIGTTYGLLAAVKLFWPDTLPYSLFSFGRIRPIHTNIVMFGWSSFALIGVALFVVTRTSKVNMVRRWAAQLGLVLWNLALIASLITLSLGITQGPQEYREFIWPVALLYGLGLACIATTIISTVANRTMTEIYISNWYILGALCWMTILFTIGYLPFNQQGLGNIIIQGYYMHNAVGLWFTPLVLGICYYALPRMLAKPIYSYALGVLGFWTNMIFYTLIGGHHYIFSATPWWLQTTAILFSVGMMVPVWSGTGNFFLTARGSWYKIRKSYALIFLLVGIWGYALASTQGTIEAFRSANVYWHFTNFTVGHSHLAMYGFVTFAIWGAIYGLLPKITGRGPSESAMGLHFWLAFLGGSLYVTSISIAGVLQGASWVAGESFIASVDAAAPLWLWRSIGGFMMVASHIVFFINLWNMRPINAPADPLVSGEAIKV
ncbi:MAG: cytochrome c oxidase cbb3-type subunit 1 [Gammaproteobacteria bacterium]|jgi:cytochrome c oxidase cbb3-type subunit 1